MDVALIVVIAFCLLLLPTAIFLICRLHLKMKKKTHKKASRVSVVSIAPVSKKKPSITLPPISEFLLLCSLKQDPDAPALTVAADPSQRRVSACYLTEMKLMDIGPLPRDQAALEAMREREKEKQKSLDV
ncbi:unnamed protein product [Strongylus vulgaris]|uniref:Uncharacterized protein n=1 Tax=Strongylus vulgaris TaxID=40348 RepID=A0A3P7KZ47_STRVU|nr:unnamed protein product [Strongylus vulgaris]